MAEPAVEAPPPGAAEPELDTGAWHLVRIPTPAQLARKRGWPADHIDYPAMRGWCERHCQARWREEETLASGTVYRFETRADALAFALRWFPFKCG